MTITEYARAYISKHGCPKKYARSLRTAANHFTHFAGKKPLGEITAEELSAWASHEALTKASKTAANKLIHLSTLLRAAIAAGLRGPCDGTLGWLKTAITPLRAFSPDETAAMVGQARKLTGFFRKTGIRRNDWWVALLLTAWDTALPLATLLALECVEIDEKTLRVTHGGEAAYLREETYTAIERVRGQRTVTAADRVLPYDSNRHELCREFRDLAEAAGIMGGTFHQLMRGAKAHRTECGVTTPRTIAETKPARQPVIPADEGAYWFV